jgi:hypothetical protein
MTDSQQFTLLEREDGTPEASRMVAGGASVSERPPVSVVNQDFDPGWGRGELLDDFGPFALG